MSFDPRAFEWKASEANMGTLLHMAADVIEMIARGHSPTTLPFVFTIRDAERLRAAGEAAYALAEIPREPEIRPGTTFAAPGEFGDAP